MNIKKILGILSAFFFPFAAYAHEVYVLSQEKIESGLNAPHLNPISIILSDTQQFLFWALLTLSIISAVFFISISRRLEDKFDPYLIKLKHYAPFIARITIGAALIAGAYHETLFGPELPIASITETHANLIVLSLVVIGTLILVGVYARIAALAGIFLFLLATTHYGTYMITYANYLGELVVILLIGSHRVSIERTMQERRPEKPAHAIITQPLYEKFSHYSFFILRVAFGISLIYASYYAKYLHSDLALQVVLDYNLTNYFPFDPLFIVLGASIIEMLLGTLFILGIEIRFASAFLGVFLTLSLLYFGEAVWPHIILFGVAAALFAYGYDKYSLEGRFFKKGNREPIF